MRCYKPFFAVALLATLAACADEPTGPSAGPTLEPGAPPRWAMNATSARVVGYLPNWYPSLSLDSVRYNKMTHVVYAFVDTRSNGSLTGISMSGDTRLAAVVQKAHAAGTKALISVGGGGNNHDTTFAPMAASPTARSAFVSNMVTFVNNYNLDGVDIDWEFPNDSADAANFAVLMSDLDTAMHSRGKLLTAAVAAGSWFGRHIKSSVFNNVDFLVLMAYDGEIDTPAYSHAVSALDYWSGRGLPQSKTVLGVQFYGNDTIPSTNPKPYRHIVRDDATAPTKDVSNGWYYNGVSTMKQKTTLSLQRASGIGIWEVTQDTSAAGISLLGAIHEVMNTSKVVYDDALTTGWANWSWGTTVSFTNTSPVFMGSKSISAAYTAAWGGLYAHHSSGVSPTGLATLEFYVHGGSAGGQNLIVQLADTGGWRAQIGVNGYIAGGSVAAGTWRKVTIPLATLGISSLAITDLVIQDNSGGAQPTFYVDQIQFVP
ncbi:MAG TPA: glycosyl hydrolase family 18 protein [Longimicrobium sp.]